MVNIDLDILIFGILMTVVRKKTILLIIRDILKSYMVNVTISKKLRRKQKSNITH